MYEYEFRLVVELKTQKDIQEILSSFENVKKRSIFYIKNYRRKTKHWELKNKLKQVVIYYSGLWFKFVESKEKQFSTWTLDEYTKFYQDMGFFQNPFQIETRYEVELSKNAKIYGFVKDFSEYGLVFELEVQNTKKRLRNLPLDVSKLQSYKNIFKYFQDKPPFQYKLTKCGRKRVLHTNRYIENALVALKHDGIFGLIYSYENFIHEVWEGNIQNLLLNISIGNGIVFAAEKMEDDTVFLLDVYQIRGVQVSNVHDVLLKFLPSLKNLPTNYRVQKYYTSVQDLPFSKSKCDGIIFHDANDVIYKWKSENTIDLLFENGYFTIGDKKIKTDQNLENGIVYECDLNFKIIKQRPDRFVSNTLDQISDFMKL